MNSDELKARIELIKKRQKAATSSTGTKALLIQTFSDDLPWLIEQAERVADAEAALTECEAEREAAQKRFEAASELSAARGVEISELRERIAECEREKAELTRHKQLHPCLGADCYCSEELAALTEAGEQEKKKLK